MNRAKRKRSQQKVALAYSLGAPFQEQITHGILQYSRENRPWEIVSSPEGNASPLESLSSWKGSGALAMLETKAQLDAARSLPFPVINLASSLAAPDIPTISSNQGEIGRLAAEHFLAKNFRRFGFYGLKDVGYSDERLQGFRTRLLESGFDCLIHRAESSLLAEDPWNLDGKALGKWLKSIHKPIGILSSHDYRARILLQRCPDLGFDVPTEIAVIGVDNDPMVCQFSVPPLTSIRQNGEVVGYRAAQLLHRILNGETVERGNQWIAPKELIERDSTRVVAVENSTLRQCLDLIEKHFTSPIDVAWLVSKLQISRRGLERLFLEELDTSPHRFLCEARIELAQELLETDPERSLKEITQSCGFTEPRRLNIVFERVTGKPLREFAKHENASD